MSYYNSSGCDVTITRAGNSVARLQCKVNVMKYIVTITVLFSIFTTPILSQEGINPGAYYPTSRSINYPFLTSNANASQSTSVVSSPVIQSGDCCQPLLPTIAQGIRDTFNALLPCRGVRRQSGNGLFFSARFYEPSCCGNQFSTGEVILDSVGEPTPANGGTIPEEVSPEIIQDSVQFRRLPSDNSPSVITKSPPALRSVSSQIHVQTYERQTGAIKREYPINPLRP